MPADACSSHRHVAAERSVSEEATETFTHNDRLARTIVSDRVLPRNIYPTSGPPPDLRKVAGEDGRVRHWSVVLTSFRGAVKATATRTGKGEGGALLLAGADDIPAGPSSHKRKYTRLDVCPVGACGHA
jgi:hypothetical protein